MTRLNQPNMPVFLPCFANGRRMVAQSAGVSTSATISDSTMAEMMVTENWR